MASQMAKRRKCFTGPPVPYARTLRTSRGECRIRSDTNPNMTPTHRVGRKRTTRPAGARSPGFSSGFSSIGLGRVGTLQLLVQLLLLLSCLAVSIRANEFSFDVSWTKQACNSSSVIDISAPIALLFGQCNAHCLSSRHGKALLPTLISALANS